MANTKEIQDRIKSINDTLKITNAMYMISSSKLKKSKKMLADTEPYFFTLQSEMSRILRHLPDMEDIYFKTNEDKLPEDRKVGYIVITADKGLASSYNHNILKMAEEHLKNHPNHSLFFCNISGTVECRILNCVVELFFNLNSTLFKIMTSQLSEYEK